jgi:hypothetical protein
LPEVRARSTRAIVSAILFSLLLGVAATRADVTATHDTVIRFNSQILPRALPRSTLAPVGIRIEGHVQARKNREPAALNRIQLAINRAAHLDRAGLPVCDLSSIDPANSVAAMAACGDARVGYGRVRAESRFSNGKRYFFDGRTLLFNGRLANGRPAILIHVFNSRPPSSFVFPFTISHRKGRYATLLTANVKISRWSRITDFKFVLDRRYRYKGRQRSFFSASCPAPAGFSVGISPFVRATLSFGDGAESSVSVLGSCKVAG